MVSVIEDASRGSHRGAAPEGDEVARTVIVVDPIGEVFARLSALELPVALWRVSEVSSAPSRAEADLLIHAAYGPIDWDVLASLDACPVCVVMTTAFSLDEAQKALDRGLIGYIDAGMDPDVLARAVRGVLVHDESAFPRDVIGRWMRARRNGHDGDPSNGLTGRQQEIVKLIARGATDKEIAAQLGIAPATAQKHVTNILQRLHVPNRAAAVAATSARRRS